MKNLIYVSALLSGFLIPALAATAESLSDISNYRDYSELFSSSGQPSAEQLVLLKEAGFERIIYLAFTTSHTALAAEDKIVKDLGMDYVHIAVDFDEPTIEDFDAFASLMRSEPDAKTLLHCQVNFRASSFSFLYRVIEQDIAVEDAKTDLDTVWQPDEVWRDFIFSVLQENGISPDCELCLWSEDD